MKRIFALALCAFLFASAGAQAAAADRYKFDPAHTQVLFSIEHMGLSRPFGRFDKTDGGYTFDPADVEHSTVEATIDVNSLDMGLDKWNEHLKSKDFFNAAQFPTMTFKSTKIEKTGEKTGKLTGDLTLLGVTKPVTLDVTYFKTAPHPMNKNLMSGFTAQGTLKRSDFGMGAYIPMVGDDVTLMINVEGIRQDFDAVEKK
jgi:polyisoprenoid-binding protein YceI